MLLCSVLQLQDGRMKPFLVKPLPSQLMKPLLVFVNPKSGGNQVVLLRPCQQGQGQRLLCGACRRRAALLLLNVLTNTA